MKLLTLISIFITTLSFGQDYYVASLDASKMFYDLVKEYRRDNNIVDSCLVFDSVGCNIISNKSKYFATNKSCGHSNDPNNSWDKCSDHAKQLLGNSGYYGSMEIAQLVPIEIPKRVNSKDYIKNIIESKDFWITALNSFKESRAHNSSILDSIPLNRSTRALEYKYVLTVSAAIDFNKNSDQYGYVAIHSTITRLGYGGHMYAYCPYGKIICKSSEYTEEKQCSCEHCFSKDNFITKLFKR